MIAASRPAVLLLCAIAATAAMSCGGDDFTPSEPSGAADAASDGAEEASTQAETEAGAAPATCDIQSTLAACDDCINSKCLDSCQKCADNDACEAIFFCVISKCVGDSTVPDQACAQGCVQANPAGFSDFGAFWTGLSPGCVPTKCGSECPW